MDKTALVSVDIERGSEVLDALNSAKLKIAVALWAFSPEYEDWRLIIAARQLDSVDLRDAYRRVNDSLTAAGLHSGQNSSDTDPLDERYFYPEPPSNLRED